MCLEDDYFWVQLLGLIVQGRHSQEQRYFGKEAASCISRSVSETVLSISAPLVAVRATHEVIHGDAHYLSVSCLWIEICSSSNYL